jgi:hypothetical protein
MAKIPSSFDAPPQITLRSIAELNYMRFHYKILSPKTNPRMIVKNTKPG